MLYHISYVFLKIKEFFFKEMEFTFRKKVTYLKVKESVGQRPIKEQKSKWF